MSDLSFGSSTDGKKQQLPGSVAQALTITKYELLNYFRSRRFFVLLIIGVAISGLLTGLVGYYRFAAFLSSPLDFYSNWWGTTANFIVILSGIFFGGDAISGEFQNKTGYFLVGNPLRRSSIYAGKWLAAFIASIIIFAIYTAITVGNELYYFGLNMPWQFGESVALSILYLVAVLGFTFFFSSLFKSSSMSILVTAILFLFAFTAIQTIIENFAQVEPWFMITYGAEIISNVLASTYPPHIQTIQDRFGPRGVSITVYNATIPEGIAILLVYFAITAVLGLLIFERKEFN